MEKKNFSALKDPELIRPYEKLSRRAHRYRKHHVPAVVSILFGFGYVIVVGILEGMEVLKIPEPRILWFLPFFLGIIIYAVLGRMASIYDLRNEDWLFLRIWTILESLDAYRKAGLETDRNKAVKKLAKAIGDIEEWEVSNLTIVKEVVGKHVIPLKQNLRARLIPAIQEGDEENLEKGYDFLKSFAKYLVKENPELYDLEKLNNRLTTITTIPSEKPRLKSRFSALFRTHRGLQHILVFISCGFAGFLAYHIGYCYLNVPIGHSYTAGLAFAGVLIAAYLNYIKK